jgi:hypothetical protein
MPRCDAELHHARLAESGSTEELEKLQFLDPVEPLGSTGVHVEGGVSGAITIVKEVGSGDPDAGPSPPR